MKIYIRIRIQRLFVNLLGIIVFSCCFWECSDDFEYGNIDVTSQEYQLSLKSSNNVMIADNIYTLKKEASVILKESFGIDKDFEITDLKYFPTSDKEYLVFIEYLTSDGIAGNFCKSNSSSVKSVSDNVIMRPSPRLKSQNENSGPTPVYFTCIPNGSCTSCGVVVAYDQVTNTSTITCTCPECSMQISYGSN
jgi:hypothetical protein